MEINIDLGRWTIDEIRVVFVVGIENDTPFRVLNQIITVCNELSCYIWILRRLIACNEAIEHGRSSIGCRNLIGVIFCGKAATSRCTIAVKSTEGERHCTSIIINAAADVRSCITAY